MRTRLAALLAAVTLLAPTAPVAGTFDDPASTGVKFQKKVRESKEDELLVKFKDTVLPAARDARHAAHGNLKIRELKVRGRSVDHVRISPARTVDEAIARYRADPTVEYAEPNYTVRAMRLPSEPQFNLLWGLNNTGQTLGTPGADIKAAQAWDLSTGSADVVVMVIDSGVDLSHPDLAANIWVNAAETAGNGIDDDGNGYVDDVNGIDVVNRDSDPSDDYGHGTHVAGTLGATGNNGLGVVGVNWSVKILPCKILDATGSGTIADAVACLEYARSLKARGVNIVATNNSYGALGAYSQTMADAIAAQGDILFIAAAGNFGLDNDSSEFYPADYALPNVISVAATDHNDRRPSFSSFGRRSVHLGAPGVGITSTTPGNTYASASGTSMAAPHVAGVAALLKAQDPRRDWRTIRNLILAGGDANLSLADQTISGRRLNAFTSASCANRPLFSVLAVPAAFAVGVPVTVSALSIDCGNAVGPVTATSSAGESFTLRDDGVAPDPAAGDGIFTASWTPTRAFGSLTLSSPAGAEQIGLPDLTVLAVTGPASANRGDTVALGVTVANLGTMAAPASSVNLFLSVDGLITSGDTLIGSVATPALAAGAQQVLTAFVAIPPTAATATYFLGAIADPAETLAEGNEGNNARAGSTIAIGSPDVDLTATALSGPATAFTGDPITVSATVVNLGTAPSAATSLQLVLSSDQVITTADTLIGIASVGALAGGASQVISATVPVPVGLPPGTYYLGAIVDPGNAVIETNETNNTRVGNLITTTTRPVDLTLTSVSGPSTSKDAQAISLGATVKNLGTIAAPASTVRWYLSTDNLITTADIPIATASVPSLGSGSSKGISTSARIPTSVSAGSYFIGAIVDPDNTLAETNDANNARAGGAVAVSYSVDLTMTAVSGPVSGATGQNVTFTGTLKNQGLIATPGNVTVGFYLSSKGSITTGDNLIVVATVPSVGAGQSVPVSATAALRTTLAAGTYTIGAIADPGQLVAESDEGNNSRAANTIAVDYGPDLVVSALSGPASADRGQVITLTGTVTNQGTGAIGALSDQDKNTTGAAVQLGLYLSNNATISAADTRIGSVSTTLISAGQSIPVAVNVTIPTSLAPGTYTLGAIADYGNAIRESNEMNNARAGSLIVIR